eukprot:764851-Hanusia_phi.AAC.2
MAGSGKMLVLVVGAMVVMVAAGEGGGRKMLVSGPDAWKVQKPVAMLPRASSTPASVLNECADRTDWQFVWDAGGGSVWTSSCAEYVMQGGNCYLDVGYALHEERWITADEACPYSCGTCCEKLCGLTDSSCSSACHNMSSSYQSLVEFALSWNRSNLSSQTAFELVPFQPEAYLGNMVMYLLPVTPGTKTRYKLDGTSAASPWVEGSRVEVSASCPHFQAVAFLAASETSSEVLSEATDVSIEIKTPPPLFGVAQCAIESANGTEMLQFDGVSSNYSGQVCNYAIVEIIAQGLLNTTTRIRYAQTALTGNATMDQAVGRATVILLHSGVVAAQAARPGCSGSDIVLSQRFTVSPAAVQSWGWMGTAGLWNFSFEAAQGSYVRGLNSLNGCAETQPTLIRPSEIRDSSGILGPAVLKGPRCKSGAWDLPAPFSPSILSFLHKSSDGSLLEGLQFGALNSELVVLEDLAQAEAAGLLPSETLSVEIWFSVDTTRSLPLAGLVSARSDGPELAGHQYGKGWSLSYSVDDELDETKVEFALATQKQETIPGFGGFGTLVGRVSPRIPAVRRAK